MCRAIIRHLTSIFWSVRSDSNRRPAQYEAGPRDNHLVALDPTEPQSALVIRRSTVSPDTEWSSSGRNSNAIVGTKLGQISPRPIAQNQIHLFAHHESSLAARRPGHQQSVIWGVEVAHGNDDGHSNCFGFEAPAGRTAADSAAAPLCSMRRDVLGTWDRTAGKQIANCGSKCRRERLIVFGPPFLVAETSSFSRFLVGQAFRLP